MGKLYTALSVKQYGELLQKKNLTLIPVEQNRYALEFTEDKLYWVTRLEKQDDLENVADYRCSIIIEFEIQADIINSLISSKETGRVSQKMVSYYETINKPVTISELKDKEVNILSIMDVYESDETGDGISQLWSLVVDSEDSEMWRNFSEGVYKISCLGGIPGAVEEAQKLAGI